MIQKHAMAETKYIIKALFYSKPRMIHDSTGEAVLGRYGVIYTVGIATAIAGIGMRKVDEITWNDEAKVFEIKFNKKSKEYPAKGIITVPYLPDTEVYYQIEE